MFATCHPLDSSLTRDTLFDRASLYYKSCSSTNDIAHKYLLHAAEGSLIVADYQYKGRGQRGSRWLAASGKNLLFSLVLHPEWLPLSDLFSLNIITSLAIYDALSFYFPKEISIKWPNDIYFLDQKLGGILIETNVSQVVKTALIGIGLNVNQTDFGFANFTSLAMHANKVWNRSLLLTHILDQLGHYYGQLQSNFIDSLWEKYLHRLYRKCGFHLFSTLEGPLEGRIITVNRVGELVLEKRNGGEYRYKPKEICFI